MPISCAKPARRRTSPVRVPLVQDREARRPEQMRARLDSERRSKRSLDRPSPSTVKGKGRSHQRTATPKKRKVVDLEDSGSSERKGGEPDDNWSAGDGMAEEEVQDLDSKDSSMHSDEFDPRQVKREKILKKPVTLDLNGLPWGNMKECLADDIKKYAKSLDPTCNWDSQPLSHRSQLFKQLYEEWDMLGQSFKLSEKFMGPIITKVLITTRWRLNTLVDGGQTRPADVTEEQWRTLVNRRKSDESLVMSEHMRCISQGKGSKTAQLKAIERDVIVKLTLMHNRKPFQTEITDEVAREYTHQQTEKRKAALQKGTDMEDVRARVFDMEGTVSCLEERMGQSHARMEDMLKSLLCSQLVKGTTVQLDCLEAAASGKAQQLPVLSSDAVTTSLTMNALLSPAPIDESGNVTARLAQTVAESPGKEGASGDRQVQEFLNALLQEPEEVGRFPKCAKSADTNILPRRSEEIQDHVGEHDVGDSGIPSSPNSKLVSVTDQEEFDEEGAAIDSTTRMKRSGPVKSQTPKSASALAMSKAPKSVGPKGGSASKPASMATKNVKRGEGNKKK